jgi:hypothetical protein
MGMDCRNGIEVGMPTIAFGRFWSEKFAFGRSIRDGCHLAVGKTVRAIQGWRENRWKRLEREDLAWQFPC